MFYLSIIFIIFIIFVIFIILFSKKKINKIDDLIKNKKKLFYFPCIGLTNFEIPVYTEFQSDTSKIFFKILNKYKLPYYLFAGSAIGLLRDSKNIPWVDDYDIIMLKEYLPLFKNQIIPILRINNIIIEPPDLKLGNFINKLIVNNNLFTCSYKFKDYTKLQVDIFTSYINNKKNVKCLRKIWVSTNTNLNIKTVHPPKYYYFDNFDFKLPFFNDYKKSVKDEYGDVLNKVVFHKNHRKLFTINKNFNIVYKEFNNLKNYAIQNTKNTIFINKDFKYKNTLYINNKSFFQNRLSILKFININNIGIIHLKNNKLIYLIYSIKYYFPKILIILYLSNYSIPTFLLNKVDIVKFKNNSIKSYYENPNIIYLKKPIFKL